MVEHGLRIVSRKLLLPFIVIYLVLLWEIKNSEVMRLVI